MIKDSGARHLGVHPVGPSAVLFPHVAGYFKSLEHAPVDGAAHGGEVVVELTRHLRPWARAALGGVA